MSSEHATTTTGKIENIFGRPGFPILDPSEITTATILISANKLNNLPPDKEIDLDKGKNNLNLIITGMPRWGKTTATKYL